jgi:two-component system response regulator YesN
MESGRPAQLDHMASENGSDRSERYGSGMIRFYTKLQSIDAYVVKLMNEKELFEPERTMRKVVISVCIMFLLVCALSAYVLTGFLYRPVRKIMHSLKELIVGGEDVSTRTMDGVDEIKRSVVQMLSENQSLRSTYTNILPMMRDRYYYHVLLGKYDSAEQMLEQASLLQIDLYPGEYGLIVVEIDAPVFPSIQATHSAKLGLLHLLEHYFVKPRNAVIVEIESDCWTVLFPVRDQQDDKEFNQAAFAECKEMQDQAEQKWNVSVSFGIGKCGNGPGDMHITFQGVRRLLKYKISLGSGLIMNLGDRELQLQAPAEQRVVINEDKLQHMLQTGDFTQTEGYVRDLFEQMSRQPNIALVQMRLFELLHSILRAGEKIGIAAEELFGSDRLLVEELYLLKSHEAALDWFLQIVREMSGFLRQQMVDQELRHIRGIVEYVSEHFSRIDLSLTLVSEQFNMSPTYISRVFKKETGYSFMDYINLLRLEKAKRLLLVSDAKIYEVALEAGFQTTHYFIRLFKTKFGVTPGDFRKYSVNVSGD